MRIKTTRNNGVEEFFKNNKAIDQFSGDFS